MTRSPFFAAVISLLLATLAVAEIKSITISDDSRPLILLQTFGFTQTGHVTISVSSSSSQDSSRTGFYLVEQESVLQVDIELQQNSSFCVLDSHYVHHFDQSYQVTSPGLYSLFFANCGPGAKVSMKFQTEMYNLDPNGLKSYLPAGSTQLPGIPHGWNIPFYVFQFLGNVLLFMVIFLVGTGWSILKPKLQEKEEKLLMLVIPFEVIFTIASVVIGETGPYVQNWSLWTEIFLFAEVSCWVAMRLVIVCWMCIL
ncbi:unnamed protein product [Brassica oleracea var. botrytis]